MSILSIIINPFFLIDFFLSSLLLCYNIHNRRVAFLCVCVPFTRLSVSVVNHHSLNYFKCFLLSFFPSFLPFFLSSFLPFFLSSFLPGFFLSSFLPFFLSSSLIGFGLVWFGLLVFKISTNQKKFKMWIHYKNKVFVSTHFVLVWSIVLYKD